jgi:hypothetical protein
MNLLVCVNSLTQSSKSSQSNVSSVHIGTKCVTLNLCLFVSDEAKPDKPAAGKSVHWARY